MEIGAILLTIAVLLMSALFVSKPYLFPEKAHDVEADNTEISSLLAEKDRYLGMIQILEQDHDLNKISDEDYSQMRADLLKKASTALRKIDELENILQATTTSTKATKKVTAANVDIEDLISQRRAMKKDRADGFCPHCGKAIVKTDKFCPSCGKKVDQ